MALDLMCKLQQHSPGWIISWTDNLLSWLPDLGEGKDCRSTHFQDFQDNHCLYHCPILVSAPIKMVVGKASFKQ